MAQSSGGQSISLLCVCLENMFKNDEVGVILHELGKKTLSRTMTVCGISQIARASKILSAKLFAIGFGNILAQRLLRVYQFLKIPAPDNLFGKLNNRSVVELLHLLTWLYAEEDQLLRITGSQSMAQLMTMMTILFPENTPFVVDSTIMQQGHGEMIVLEIDST